MFENPCVSNGYAPPSFVFHQGSAPLWTTSFTDGPAQTFLLDTALLHIM